MAVTYLRLFDPTQQFQLKNGAINVAGLLKVKLEGTDDYAPVFDEDGTQLAQPVILDNNGRSKGLFVDSAKVYWLEVDDRDGYELFTIRKMTPCGGGGGSSLGSKYEVISTDGTVVVDRYSEDGTVYFDLSTAFTTDSATWGATFATVNSIAGDNDWAIIPVATSTGTSQWSNGWTAGKDCVADIAASLEMSGDSSAISTVDVMCVFTVDGVGVSTEYSQLDPSDSRGKVSFEYKGELLEGQVVDCRIFVKSVEAMAPALVAKAYFNEECDGIIGGGGSGGGDYHAGDYVEITENRVINVTGLQPQSAMSAYVQQSSFFSISSVVSSVQNDTGYISSVVSGLTGGTGDYVEKSAISAQSSEWNKISSLSSYVEKSAISAQSSEWNEVSGLSGKLDNSASSNWYPMTGNPSGFLTAHQELTGYVPVSAISAESSTWNSASAMSAYALSSDVSGVIGTVSTNSASWGGGGDAFPAEIKSGTALKAVVTTGFQGNAATRPTLFISSSPYQTAYPRMMLSENHTNTSQGKSAAFLADAFEFYTGTGTKVLRIDPYTIAGSLTGIYGSSFSAGKSGVSGSGWQYGTAEHDQLTGVYDTVSANSAAWAQDTVYSAGEYIDISGTTISVTGLQPVSGMSAYVEQSAFDDCCSAMSGYVSSLQNDVSSISSTVSGLTGTYVEISSISAQSSQWNEVSGLSGKLDSSASSNFYTTANESGFVSSAYVNSAVSGKQDILSAGDNISIVGNVISAANQKQSNWTESSNTSVQFILNKPLTKELVAGTNITMTEDLTSVTIAAAGTTYSAGTGISISSGTISVDTSVIATQGDLPVFGTITV